MADLGLCMFGVSVRRGVTRFQGLGMVSGNALCKGVKVASVWRNVCVLLVF